VPDVVSNHSRSLHDALARLARTSLIGGRISEAVRLRNGNTLIDEGACGRIPSSASNSEAEIEHARRAT